MPDSSARVAFLKQSHLFRGVSDKDLAAVADAMKENTYQKEETVFAEGTAADSFYMIFKGRVRLTRRAKDRSVKLATLFRGDYFGERGLLKGGIRNATVTAEPGTTLLILYRADFKKLLKQVPNLWNNFDLMMDSRQLAGELNFPWLAENEVIYFLARKHYTVLLRTLIWPFLGLLLSLAFLGLGFTLDYTPSGLPLGPGIAAFGGFAFVLVLAWAGWLYLDWSNDYYVVTNQRVVYLEKVIGLYDNRQEAPMSTILSVNTESDYWGRQFFDYGTVIVRTFVGQIRMTYVRHPLQAAAMIEEYWNRTKQVARQMDEESIKNIIRNKLGMQKPGPPPVPPPPPPPAPASKESRAHKMWREAFALRIESGGAVIYHKHWFVLLRDTFPQIGGMLLVVASLIAYPILLGPMPAWLIFILFTLLIGLALWWFYGYEDWKNDIYQVTPDQIIDVYKKPFGVEDRKAAPLEGILSTEYRRNGIIEVLFNFGTVYISVGGSHFDFEDVADPPTVQQDVVRRLQVKIIKKKETESAGERERMAEWLAYYHKTIQEINEERKQARDGDLV
jgi:hypothetical protein